MCPVVIVYEAMTHSSNQRPWDFTMRIFVFLGEVIYVFTNIR